MAKPTYKELVRLLQRAWHYIDDRVSIFDDQDVPHRRLRDEIDAALIEVEKNQRKPKARRR